MAQSILIELLLGFKFTSLVDLKNHYVQLYL